MPEAKGNNILTTGNSTQYATVRRAVVSIGATSELYKEDTAQREQLVVEMYPVTTGLLVLTQLQKC
jgi:hypothetical protein